MNIEQITNKNLTAVYVLFILGEDSLTTTKPRDGLDARSFLDKSKLLEVIPRDEYINGTSVLNIELFVVRDRVSTSQVNVCNFNNFTWTRNITITGSSTLCAIVASTWYNCLYISDPGLNVVYLYRSS